MDYLHGPDPEGRFVFFGIYAYLCGMKECTKCKTTREFSEFHKKAKSKDGLDPICRPCKREYDSKRRSSLEIRQKNNEQSKLRRIALKKKFIDFMSDKSCIQCGESHMACLQFDHKDTETKSFIISDAVAGGFSWTKILSEMDKCDILCANCHAKRTAQQFNWYRV